MPRVRLHALIADRTRYGHFAKYYARFRYKEETIRGAACPYGKPLALTPYDCSFLGGIIQPPLYGYTKG